MSKERAMALQQLIESTIDFGKKGETESERREREKENQIRQSIIYLAGDGLNSLERIAGALEKLANRPAAVTVVPLGAGKTVGEMSHFDAALEPGQITALIDAIQNLASATWSKRA